MVAIAVNQTDLHAQASLYGHVPLIDRPEPNGYRGKVSVNGNPEHVYAFSFLLEQAKSRLAHHIRKQLKKEGSFPDKYFNDDIPARVREFTRAYEVLGYLQKRGLEVDRIYLDGVIYDPRFGMVRGSIRTDGDILVYLTNGDLICVEVPSPFRNEASTGEGHSSAVFELSPTAFLTSSGHRKFDGFEGSNLPVPKEWIMWVHRGQLVSPQIRAWVEEQQESLDVRGVDMQLRIGQSALSPWWMTDWQESLGTDPDDVWRILREIHNPDFKLLRPQGTLVFNRKDPHSLLPAFRNS